MPIVVGLGTMVAMLGPVVVRRFVALDRLHANNEVAGFKFATVSVLYAVLAGFTIIVVWEKFSQAEDVVARESGAVLTLYRLAAQVDDGDMRVRLETALTDYTRAVVEEEWPAMRDGHHSPAARRRLDDLYAVVVSLRPDEPARVALFSEMLRQLDSVTQNRRARLVMAAGGVPGIVMLALFVGAFLIVGFACFFGAEILAAQVLMAGILGLMVFSGLEVILVIDHPFAGPVNVEPAPFLAVLEAAGLDVQSEQRPLLPDGSAAPASR